MCSWVWCGACCRGAPASVLRQLRSQGIHFSRSWSCLADWLWGSAPVPTAPRPWADPPARHQLPEDAMTQYVTPPKACFPVIPPPVCRLREKPQRPAITHCLRNNHFKCQALKICRNLSRLHKSSETKSCKVPLLGKYTCRYRFTHHYAAQVPNFNYTYKWKDILKATAVL